MAKGENLEKPKKKGGMVIVIGMGAKPKDMKKSFGRGSADAKLAGRAKTLRRFRSGRNDIDEILDKRKIDPDEFHGEFFRRHNMSFEDYLESGKTDVDIQGMIDEMAERAHGQRREEGREERRRAGRARAIREGLLNTERFRGMLRARGIDEDTWLRNVRSIADDELSENTFNDLIDSLENPDRAEEFDDSPEAAFERRDAKMRRGADRNDEDADAMFDRLTRIFENRGYRNPMMAAFEAMQGMPQGSELGASAFNPEEDAYSDTHAPYSVRNEPSTVFTVPFAGGGQRADRPLVGRHSPRGSVESRYYGFRGAGPIYSSNRRQIEDQEADMDAIEADMYGLKRTSSDSTNVMDAAWALLKGNPDMTDRRGKSVHPAAMNYAQYARALTDSLQYRGPQNEQEQINLERNPMLGNMDKTRGDVPDRASATLFRNTAESKHPLAQSKLGGETMREHSDFARGRAKRDTRQYMGTDESEFGSDPHIVRMPRPHARSNQKTSEIREQTLNAKPMTREELLAQMGEKMINPADD